MLSQHLEDAVSAALLRLTHNFGVFTDEAAFALQLDTWTKAAERHPWLTAEVIGAAEDFYVDRKTERPDERKVPPVGDFLEVCRTIKRQLERESLKALPEPRIDQATADAGYERFRQAAKAITGRFPNAERARR